MILNKNDPVALMDCPRKRSILVIDSTNCVRKTRFHTRDPESAVHRTPLYELYIPTASCICILSCAIVLEFKKLRSSSYQNITFDCEDKLFQKGKRLSNR